MGVEDKARLVTSLLSAQFGPPVAEVANLLITRGQLPFSHLVRLSSLPPSIIYRSLLVLSFQSLLWHSESDVNGHLTELYEINVAAVDCRVRGALYADLAAGLPSSWALEGLDEAVRVLWREGMVDRDTLVHALAELWYDSEGMNVDGKGKAKAKAQDMSLAEKKASKLLARAVRDGFISIVTPGSQLSPSSLEIKWYEELRYAIKGLPSNKEIVAISEKLSAKKRQFAEEERELAKGVDPAGDDMPKKKRKLGMAGGDEYLPDLSRRRPFFRINIERFHIRWRSQLMCEHCEAIFNPAAAAIFRTILDLVEGDIDTIQDPTSRPFTINEVLQALGQLAEGPSLSNAFAPKTADKTWSPPKRLPETILEILRVLGAVDDRSAIKSALLSPLSSGRGDNGTGNTNSRWVVQFADLGRTMKRIVVEGLIRDKVGEKGLVVWRILDDKGKLEEKMIGRLAFLSSKEVREQVAHLASHALIEQQELPRTADRNPGRTIYLWYVDYDKVVTSLIDHQTKASANVQAQKAYQLDKRAGLVSKRERSDVRADPDNLLTKADKDNWEDLEILLDALTVAEMRIDRDVFVLRELDAA